jgi:hypothetical protein
LWGVNEDIVVGGGVNEVHESKLWHDHWIKIYFWVFATNLWLRFFFLVISIGRLGQHMSPLEYRIILRYRLIIPWFLIDEVCSVYRKAYLDLGNMQFIVESFQTSNTNMTLWETSFFRCVGVSVKKETLVNFLIDPQEGKERLRPVDVLVYTWVWGKHACID